MPKTRHKQAKNRRRRLFMGKKLLGKNPLRCALIVLSALIMFPVFGCAGSKVRETGELPVDYIPGIGGKIRVTCRADVYPNEDTRAAVRNWTSWFVNKNPGVYVEFDFNTANYSAQIASKTLGDVFWLADDEVYKFAVTDQALMPLDYYIEALGIDLTEVYGGIQELAVVNGKIYFAAACTSIINFVYNVDMLTEAGILEQGERLPNDWTWDDFKTYCSMLKRYDKDGVTLTQTGACFPFNWSPTLVPNLYGFGGEWVDKVNKKVNFTDDKVKKGVSEMISLLDERSVYPAFIQMGSAMNNEYGKLTADRIESFGFMYCTCYTTLPQRAEAYNKAGITWDAIAWPLYEYKGSPTGALGFGVFSYTKNKDTAASMVLSRYTPDGQRALHGQEGGDVPVIKSIAENEDFWYLDKRSDGYEGKNHAAFTSNYERFVPCQIAAVVPPDLVSVITDGLTNMYQSYCRNQSSWEDALKKLEKQCNEIWEGLLD